MLAKSLPRTSSELVIRVIRSKSRVRRSFSCATAAAVSNAEKATASASWTGAKRAKMAVPNRAKSPTPRTGCDPKTISRAMSTRPNSAAT